MTIKQLQEELSRIKRYYQMTGEDAEVMEENIDRLMYVNSLIDQYQREIELLDQDIQDEPRGTATVIKRAQMGMLYRVVSDLKGDE